MTEEELQLLRYPIGTFQYNDQISSAEIVAQIEYLQAFPALLADLVRSLDAQQLNTPYRPDGWTAAQVIHHIADSHMNAYIRCKLAFTEDNPTIKPYKEGYWAETVDSKDLDVAPSLQIIAGVHHRWTAFFKSLSEADWMRTMYHPQYENTQTIKRIISLYAWHSRHHYEHIRLVSVGKGYN